MFKKPVLSLFLIATTIAMSASDAFAWFKFRNKTSSTVYVAFQWYSPGCHGSSNWAVSGWWKIEPGQITTVFSGDLQETNQNYYWYAQSADGSLVWSGPFDTCTPIEAFEWCDNICNTNPFTRTLGYREKYIGGNNNYTINLTQ